MTGAVDGRDRDAAGRARNARPRDGLGRPLPYGVDGVERAPEGVRRSVEQTVDEAQHLLDAGRPFHAHEVFEDAWKAEPGPDRELWRGMAQLAVGLTHARRGNVRGAASLLRRGADVIGPFADATGPFADTTEPFADGTELFADGTEPFADPAGLDVRGLVGWARTAAADVEAGAQPTTPILRRRR